MEASSALRHFFSVAVSRAKLRRCARVGRAPVVRGRVWIRGEGRVLLGDRVVLDATSAPIEISTHPGAEVRVGDDVEVGSGVKIEARTLITIGSRVTIGRYALVMDDHLHYVRGNRFRPTAGAHSTTIEEGVRVGQRAIVLQGAFLQQGSVIRDGAVVSRRIPPHATFPRGEAAAPGAAS
jgi:acetyltransferase-like isoleucine patch superfamily enzyme